MHQSTFNVCVTTLVFHLSQGYLRCLLCAGILDQLEGERGPPRITASLFLPLQGRLACGREDGSIILVPATEAIMLHLLHGKHHHYHSQLFISSLYILIYLCQWM